MVWSGSVRWCESEWVRWCGQGSVKWCEIEWVR